ncbi:MAG: hypothetical protein CME06_05930, partial [Gemmatimonadetes bacterium]|nr:hypothetical protein [Gemmatimonadota bacterium]
EAGGLVEAELPTPVAELEGCGDPWDSSLVPLRGALAMGCSESRALTIVPIDQETTPPALLGVWVDENE